MTTTIYGQEGSRVDNLGKIRCKFTPYTSFTEDASGKVTETEGTEVILFVATGKELPKYKERPDIEIPVDDDPRNITGEIRLGKSTGIEPIILKIHSVLQDLYDKEDNHSYSIGDGTTETGDAPAKLTKLMTKGTPGKLTMTMEPYDGITKTVSINWCEIKKIAPDGQDNNGASTTEVTFQPRGGNYANMPYLETASTNSGE